MAIDQKSATPSFFNFLKEGLLLPTHNRRLFAAIFTIIVATTCVLLLGNDLAIEPLRHELDLDTKALNSTTDPSSSSPEDIRRLIRKTQDDTRALLLTSAASLVLSVIIRSAIQIVVLFAAVATYSGELHTFGSLLGKVKKQLKGPVLTLAFVYALEIAYVVLLVVVSTVFMVLTIMKYLGPFFVVVGSLLLLFPWVFLVYFGFLCSLSVVVAVGEPGCHGAGALGRAWRLMKGKRRRAALFLFVTAVLTAAFSPVYTLAKRCALTHMASGLLLGLVFTMLMAAVQLFASCAMTALYYECKESTEAASAVEYVKVSTKEQIDV